MSFRESRRSTRVPLKVMIAIEGGAECEGVTIVVNLHGALIATAIGLSVDTRISIHVHLTDKRSAARVVYVDSRNPLRCGIELEKPQNIVGNPKENADAPLLALQMRAIRETDLETRIAKLELSRTESREPSHDTSDARPNGGGKGSDPAEIEATSRMACRSGKIPQNRSLDGLNRVTQESHRSHLGCERKNRTRGRGCINEGREAARVFYRKLKGGKKGNHRKERWGANTAWPSLSVLLVPQRHKLTQALEAQVRSARGETAVECFPASHWDLGFSAAR